ncbi:proton-coupled zinc antiporter SLC30A1-like [Elgaria multicarinata webbii]|uniref:proton-coupled zinc antiporter SLC30A1-like n=1 Tax=Elgaria multicarinata webbii TaxID=159646 RepID=UPI002FCCECAF
MGAQQRKKPWTGGSSSLRVGGSAGWPAAQLGLSVGFFLVEVAASRMTGSLLLLSSAFHTLAGALALAVALADAWLAAERPSRARNTFGWARARTVGTLVGTVFLSALCLALVPEALRRAADPRATEHMLALMGIGAVGIPIHLARAGLQEGRPQVPGTRHCCSRTKVIQAGGCAQEMEDLLGNGSSTNGRRWMEEEDREEGTLLTAEKPGQWQALCRGWGMACLGPVAVLLYSLAFHLLRLGHATCFHHCSKSPCWPWGAPEPSQRERAPCWLLYLDPGLAVTVAVALLRVVWPTVRGSALVLLQAVPEELDLRLLERHLRATEGVAALLELHVWQLDGHGSLVAMAHVACLDVAAYEAVINRVRRVFCEHGVHDATVQPGLGTCPGGECHKRWGEASHKRGPATSPAVIMEYETTV